MLHHHIDAHLLRARELLDDPPTPHAQAWDEMYAILDARLGDYTVPPVQRLAAIELRQELWQAEGEIGRRMQRSPDRTVTRWRKGKLVEVPWQAYRQQAG